MRGIQFRGADIRPKYTRLELALIELMFHFFSLLCKGVQLIATL